MQHLYVVSVVRSSHTVIPLNDGGLWIVTQIYHDLQLHGYSFVELLQIIVKNMVN